MVLIEAAGAAMVNREDLSCPAGGVSCFPQWNLLRLGVGESPRPMSVMYEETTLQEDEGCPCLPGVAPTIKIG